MEYVKIVTLPAVPTLTTDYMGRVLEETDTYIVIEEASTLRFRNDPDNPNDIRPVPGGRVTILRASIEAVMRYNTLDQRAPRWYTEWRPVTESV